MLLPKTFTALRGSTCARGMSFTARGTSFTARLLELMPAASLANPESKDASDMPPVPSVAGGSAPLSHLQDVLLGLILALSLTSLACGLWLWLRFRRGDASRKRGGAVVLPSHATATTSEAGTSASTFSLPSPPPHAYPPHRILVLGSPPDASGWHVQRRDPSDDEQKGQDEDAEGQLRRVSSESEIYAVDIANGRGRCTWSPSVLYFAGQRLEVTHLPPRPVTPPTIWVSPPGRSKYSPRR